MRSASTNIFRILYILFQKLNNVSLKLLQTNIKGLPDLYLCVRGTMGMGTGDIFSTHDEPVPADRCQRVLWVKPQVVHISYTTFFTTNFMYTISSINMIVPYSS